MVDRSGDGLFTGPNEQKAIIFMKSKMLKKQLILGALLSADFFLVGILYMFVCMYVVSGVFY